LYSFLRPLLFRLDPEQAHTYTLQALRFTGHFPPLRFAVQKYFETISKPVTAFGLTFRNPVGLAAGYDKDGLGGRGLATIGFGHLEIGTVTPRPQPGNSKPRVFRLPEDLAVINRMGFPGRGAEFVFKQLSAPRLPISPILGINISKNKDTPNEEAARDYLTLFEQFAPLADYIAINVSSPNTVGLRRLQAREALEDLLGQLAAARVSKSTNQRVNESVKQHSEMTMYPMSSSPISNLQSPTDEYRYPKTQYPISNIQYRPILVKLAPDLTDEELDDALAAITRTGMDGVIATNTTLRRDGLRSPRAGETGGLSGAPLTAPSTEIIQKIHWRTRGKLPIVGVGGIMTPEDAKAKLDAGATLVQVYTGLIYAGPGLVKAIVKSL
jgi:dihydroorotate dehydrogenase